MALCALRVGLGRVRAVGALRRAIAPLPNDAWLCLMIGGEGEGEGEGIDRADPFAIRDGERAVVLGPEDRAAGLASLPAIVDELARPGVIVLVRRRRPPARDFRFDGFVTSFACSAGVLRANAAALSVPELLCYAVLQGAVDGRTPVDQLLVRQIPLRAPVSRGRAAPTSVIVPHRGDPGLLDAALASLARVQGARVKVGVDGRGRAVLRRLAARHPEVKLYRAEPSPIGPFAIRHALLRHDRARRFLLQDSDDASCSDRLAVLQAAMQETGADIIGSHELRLDERRARVSATRFPLDVSAALRGHPRQHPMMLASALFRRAAYVATGGFSTDRRFAYDTQLVLRASFLVRLANADEFLYVRRAREGSLTTAPATALGNRIRTEMLAAWTRDFRAVQRGTISLAASSLRVMPRPAPYRVLPLDSMESGA
ncbi:MAG TPA: hypothetical protein VGC42_22910 [Kofleriaceae bacterium]